MITTVKSSYGASYATTACAADLAQTEISNGANDDWAREQHQPRRDGTTIRISIFSKLSGKLIITLFVCAPDAMASTVLESYIYLDDLRSDLCNVHAVGENVGGVRFRRGGNSKRFLFARFRAATPIAKEPVV